MESHQSTESVQKFSQSLGLRRFLSRHWRSTPCYARDKPPRKNPSQGKARPLSCPCLVDLQRCSEVRFSILRSSLTVQQYPSDLRCRPISWDGIFLPTSQNSKCRPQLMISYRRTANKRLQFSIKQSWCHLRRNTGS